MVEPTMFTATIPAQSKRSMTSNEFYKRVASILLVTSIVILGGASLFWLQWSSQRGITLGYPKADVRIISTATDTSLVNSTLHFSAQSSGRDVTYTWVFGDGSTQAGSTVYHTFNANGHFTVSVTASDALNQTSTSTTDVLIVPPPPRAYFTIASIYYAYVTFDASSSSADPSTSLSNYTWNFGDGNEDTNGSSQEYHQYYSTGTFQVTLVVTDATGQTSTVYTTTVTIY